MRTKKLLLVVMAVVLLIGMTSCGDDKVKMEDSKIKKTMGTLEGDGPLHVKYFDEANGMTVDFYQSGANEATEISDIAEPFRFISNGTEGYFVYDAEKIVLKTAPQTEGSAKEMVSGITNLIGLVANNEDISYLFPVEVEKDGKTYEAEEY